MKLKAELRAITRKTTPISFDERIQRLNRLIRGWVNYYKLASIQTKLKKLDEWLRNRLRYCIWHAWKKPVRKPEEPDPPGCKTRHGVCMEPKQDGQLANSPESHFGKYHNRIAVEIKRVYSLCKLIINKSGQVNEPPD